MKKIFLFCIPMTLLLACSCENDPLALSLPDADGSASDASSSSSASSYTVTYVQDDAGDSISLVNFDRTITITFSPSGAVSVAGDELGIVKVSGNDVTADNTGHDEKVNYVLKGASADGYFKLYGENKQAITLDGLDLTNKRGAAINNQSKKRTFVVLRGTSRLADGATYTGTPDSEDEKAAFFSEGQLVFSGDGALTVSATGKAGITSDDYVRFLGSQQVTVSSTAGHGVRGKDAVVVTAGTLSVTVSAAGKKAISSDGEVIIDGGKTTLSVSGGVDNSDSSDLSGSAGIKADGNFTMGGGELTITNSGQGGKGISTDVCGRFNGGTVRVSVTGTNYGSSGSGGGPGGPGGWGGWGGWGSSGSSSSDNSVAAKAIKCDGDITVTGGVIIATAKNHEAVESKGTLTVSGGEVYAQSSDDAINAASHLTVSGGYVCAWSTGNDGLDANGDMYIEGGVVYCVSKGSPEVGMDANTEGGHRLYVSGGTLFVIGGLENGAQLTQSCYSASWNKNTWYALTIGEATYAFKTPSSGGSGLVVSGSSKPEVKSGVSVSGGDGIFEGMGLVAPTVSGGTPVSLSSYSSGNGGFGPRGRF